MSTQICRPTGNILKSWNDSDFSYIDDVVISPNIDGTADYNDANKHDDNEYEWYSLDIIPHAIVSQVDIYLLANANEVTHTMYGKYNIGNSESAAVSWSVPVTGYAWCTDSWTGLSLPMNRCNRIGIAPLGGGGGGDHLYVAVAYFNITYTLESYGRIEGGSIQGGSIQ